VYEGKSRSGKELGELDDLEDITVKGGNQYNPSENNPQEPVKNSPPPKNLGKNPANSKNYGHNTDINAARRGSFIAQRVSQDGKQRGPLFLVSGENGTSLAVTRSLGDFDAARSCIATPEFVTYNVNRGENSRIILCSDGVWDTLSSTQVSKRASQHNVTAASKRMALVAKERRFHNCLGRDDITVFVVDVFPSPPAVGCSPGCSVM